MATQTPGSQYSFSAPGEQVNVVVTATGSNLPQGVNGAFNLELVTAPSGTSFNVAFTQGYQSAVLLPGGTGQTAQLLSGNFGIADNGSGDAITMLSNGAQTIVGGKNDTITGGSGNDLLNGVAGPELVVAGIGATTVFGGIGDTIQGASSGTVLIDGSLGSQLITGGNGESTIFGGAGDTISGTGGSGASTIFGAQHDIITAGFGADLINAVAGAQSITGGGGSMTVLGGAGDTVTAGSGNAYIDGTAGNMAIAAGSGGADTIIGSTARLAGTAVDSLTGGAAAVLVEGVGKGDVINFAGQTGNATVNATAGNNAVTLGAGSITVYGGVGDTINLGAGNQYVDGSLGGAKIAVGSNGGFDVVIGALSRAAGAGADTLIGGAAQVQVQGLGNGDVVSFAGQSANATVNATAGANAVTLGSGGATVYGGVNDAIGLGSGNQYVDGSLGSENIAIGSAGGIDVVIGSVARAQGVGADTITGGAASVQVQGLGKGDVVNFAGQAGNAAISATAGNIAIKLGTGAASVYAGAGDTIALGSGNQYVDARGGAGALITLGSAGTDNIIGSTVTGAPGVTVNGSGAAAVNYNAAAGNDLVNLAGATGNAVINGFGGDTGPVNDTIIAGNGGDSVWGGRGDRIGVGNGASGTDLFTHASTIAGASIGFGSNDTVVAATYGSTVGAVTVNSALPGASSAKVTVGGFAETGGTPTDFLFYQGESAATNTAIVATSTEVSIGGAASTQFTLPDGTVMTLLGVPQADFNTSFFKP